VEKTWSYLFGGVMAAAALLSVTAPLFGWWLPKNVSTFGGGIDLMFYVILIVTAFFFVLTEAILVYALYRYAGRPAGRSAFVHGNHRLEMIWTLVPGVILFLLAVWQINAWAEVKYQSRMPRPDGKTLQMEVTARQWEWRVRYPSAERMQSWEADPALAADFRDNVHFDDVRGVNEVHVWKGPSDNEPQRVLIHLRTQDVLHSLFFPHLRLKQDALPGKTIPVWFAAKEANTRPDSGDGRWKDGYNAAKPSEFDPGQVWEIACAEFCGSRHSMMRGKLFVHESKEDFLNWLRHAQDEQQQRTAGNAAPAP
jgi:cytochrome c oxidase subunit 2